MQVVDLYPEDVQLFQKQHRENDYVLVDVRQPEEYQTEHIPGALHIPLPRFEDRLDTLPRNRELLFYCRSGRRSATAAALAAQSGQNFKALYNIQGGIAAWQGGIVFAVPRVERFDPAGGPATALRQVAALEKGAQRFYFALAQQAGVPAEIQRLAVDLAEMEGRHAQRIYSMLGRFEDLPDFADFVAALPATILEGGREVDEALARLNENGKPNCLDFVELALDIENRAYDVYKTIGFDEAFASDREMFLVLAEQEKGHLRALIKKLPECV